MCQGLQICRWLAGSCMGQKTVFVDIQSLEGKALCKQAFPQINPSERAWDVCFPCSSITGLLSGRHRLKAGPRFCLKQDRREGSLGWLSLAPFISPVQLQTLGTIPGPS